MTYHKSPGHGSLGDYSGVSDFHEEYGDYYYDHYYHDIQDKVDNIVNEENSGGKEENHRETSSSGQHPRIPRNFDHGF